MEELEEELQQYLPPLMAQLQAALQQGAAHRCEQLLSATAAAATSGGAALAPYLPQLLPALRACLALRSNETLRVRARALEARPCLPPSLVVP